MSRTNCNNCGAVLVDGKCPYCKTTWFEPGFRLGKNAYVTQAGIEGYAINGGYSGRDETGRLIFETLKYENKVELSIVGMTNEEVAKLMDAITNVNWR